MEIIKKRLVTDHLRFIHLDEGDVFQFQTGKELHLKISTTQSKVIGTQEKINYPQMQAIVEKVQVLTAEF